MLRGSVFAILVPLLVPLLVCLSGLDAYAYSYTTTYITCGQSYTLSCGSSSYTRAGTFKFSSYPNAYTSSTNCTVTFKVDGSYCTGIGDYAIYFNIKTLALGYSDSAKIIERSTYYPYVVTTTKNLYGGYQPGNTYPTSVAQFLSQYTYSPIVTLEITTTRNSFYSGNPITLDYNVLNEYATTFVGSYCSALSGYVQEDIICDSGNRVNCPYSYTPTTEITNEATAIGNCGLDYGAIAGIAIGSLFAFACIIAIGTMIARRSRRGRVLHQHTVYPHVGPAVISGNVNQAFGQPQYFQGPPPQYEAAGQQAPYPAGGQTIPQPRV
ncbi:hypothetical protein BV898_15982 [Hypsibius exemplaris]|uniref:CUB domain-containing protein n=1 Tax=Hypsibius exemplaris TaxID=2072580 RepID=A0A9X6RL11_HYPEX|nr:hypothetical protein BV898_15982 [Hypsibius exemplaris]